jgi:DHA1 family multidrug resistance protein-like MFS transporter
MGRRPVLLAGLAGMALSQGPFGDVPGLPGLYGLRVLGGLATAGMLVASNTYVADATLHDDRAEGMARFGAAVSLGLVAGPALGGLLNRPGISLNVGPARLDGYTLPFLVAGVLALAALVAAHRALPEPASEPARRRSRLPAPSAGRAGRGPGLGSLLGLVVASQFGLALFEATFVLYARDRLALGPFRASVLFMVCGLVMGILQVFAVRALARLVRPILQVSGGFALMGASIVGLVASRDFRVVLLFVALLASGTAVVTPNLSALIADRGGTRSGRVLGWKNAASSLGQSFGPLVGVVLLGWQAQSPFILAGLLLVAVGVAAGVRQQVGPGTDSP